jgi:uncharacterized protein
MSTSTATCTIFAQSKVGNSISSHVPYNKIHVMLSAFQKKNETKRIMISIAILGATGNLGRHVAQQSIAKGWKVSVAVRNRSRLSPEVVSSLTNITDLDLNVATTEQLATFVSGHDVFVSCAGVVTEGEVFTNLVDKVVTSLESLQPDVQPVCWFIAGAALLPLDTTGRVGVDLPKVRDTYGPHKVNYERLQRSNLDWRILCPGPMVDDPPLGLDKLRISIDTIPTELPSIAPYLPSLFLLPLFAMKIPEMIIPYADAASVILANVDRTSSTSKCRVGIALPIGMKGKKKEWAAQPESKT